MIGLWFLSKIVGDDRDVMLNFISTEIDSELTGMTYTKIHWWQAWKYRLTRKAQQREIDELLEWNSGRAQPNTGRIFSYSKGKDGKYDYALIRKEGLYND